MRGSFFHWGEDTTWADRHAPKGKPAKKGRNTLGLSRQYNNNQTHHTTSPFSDSSLAPRQHRLFFRLSSTAPLSQMSTASLSTSNILCGPCMACYTIPDWAARTALNASMADRNGGSGIGSDAQSAAAAMTSGAIAVWVILWTTFIPAIAVYWVLSRTSRKRHFHIRSPGIATAGALCACAHIAIVCAGSLWRDPSAPWSMGYPPGLAPTEINCFVTSVIGPMFLGLTALCSLTRALRAKCIRLSPTPGAPLAGIAVASATPSPATETIRTPRSHATPRATTASAAATPTVSTPPRSPDPLLAATGSPGSMVPVLPPTHSVLRRAATALVQWLSFWAQCVQLARAVKPAHYARGPSVVLPEWVHVSWALIIGLVTVVLAGCLSNPPAAKCVNCDTSIWVVATIGVLMASAVITLIVHGVWERTPDADEHDARQHHRCPNEFWILALVYGTAGVGWVTVSAIVAADRARLAWPHEYIGVVVDAAVVVVSICVPALTGCFRCRRRGATLIATRISVAPAPSACMEDAAGIPLATTGTTTVGAAAPQPTNAHTGVRGQHARSATSTVAVSSCIRPVNNGGGPGGDIDTPTVTDILENRSLRACYTAYAGIRASACIATRDAISNVLCTPSHDPHSRDASYATIICLCEMALHILRVHPIETQADSGDVRILATQISDCARSVISSGPDLKTARACAFRVWSGLRDICLLLDATISADLPQFARSPSYQKWVRDLQRERAQRALMSSRPDLARLRRAVSSSGFVQIGSGAAPSCASMASVHSIAPGFPLGGAGVNHHSVVGFGADPMAVQPHPQPQQRCHHHHHQQQQPTQRGRASQRSMSPVPSMPATPRMRPGASASMSDDETGRRSRSRTRDHSAFQLSIPAPVVRDDCACRPSAATLPPPPHMRVRASTLVLDIDDDSDDDDDGAKPGTTDASPSTTAPGESQQGTPPRGDDDGKGSRRRHRHRHKHRAQSSHRHARANTLGDAKTPAGRLPMIESQMSRGLSRTPPVADEQVVTTAALASPTPPPPVAVDSVTNTTAATPVVMVQTRTRASSSSSPARAPLASDTSVNKAASPTVNDDRSRFRSRRRRQSELVRTPPVYYGMNSTLDAQPEDAMPTRAPKPMPLEHRKLAVVEPDEADDKRMSPATSSPSSSARSEGSLLSAWQCTSPAVVPITPVRGSSRSGHGMAIQKSPGAADGEATTDDDSSFCLPGATPPVTCSQDTRTPSPLTMGSR